MPTYLVRRLHQFTRLSDDDKAMLRRIAGRQVRDYRVREDVVREGDKPTHVNLVIEGFACRYKFLPDGRRQITGFLLPGDLCDAHVFILKQMDHSIGALSSLRVAHILPGDILEVIDGFPRITRALWWQSLIDEAVLREWAMNLGQRSGIERVAHMLCELFVRMRSIGLVEGDTCPFPITQTDLSDALGITLVHTNRMLQDLRADGLITLRGRTLTMQDFRRLSEIAVFSPNYLHLGREGREYDATETERVSDPAQ